MHGGNSADKTSETVAAGHSGEGSDADEQASHFKNTQPRQ
jgi:hypothetical protein